MPGCDFLPVPPRGSLRSVVGAMSTDTAELTIVERESELLAPVRAAASRAPLVAPRTRSLGSGPGRSGTRARRARELARTVELAAAGVGGRRRDGAAPRLRSGARRVQPAGCDTRLRLARQPARRSRCALGHRVVPGDRALRLPARSRSLHILAHRLLPPVPAGPADDLLAGRSTGAGGRAALDGGARRRAVRHTPAHDARARGRRRRARGPCRVGRRAWPCCSPRSRRWRSSSLPCTQSRCTSRCL